MGILNRCLNLYLVELLFWLFTIYLDDPVHHEEQGDGD